MPHRMHGDITPGMDEIHHAGGGDGENGDCAVNAIILLGMHQREHGKQGDELESDGADGDIGILLQRLIQPFHADGCKQYRGTHDDIEQPVLMKRGNKHQRKGQQRIGYGTHNQIDTQQLVSRSGKLNPFVSHFGAYPYTVSRHSQLRQHGEIRYERHGKGYLACSGGHEYSRDVRKGNQRKDKV